MRLSQTYYDLLEVPANAPADVIQDSYEALADIWNPDRFPPNTRQHQLAARKLREITAAYEVLGNPQRRVEYDRRLFEEHRVSGIYWKLRALGDYGPPAGQPNVPAMLAYVAGPLAIAFLAMPAYRRDRFVSFSAWQSILFCAAAYVATLVGPWMGLQRPVYWVLWMTGVTLYWIFLMKQAYYNRVYLIPGLGQLAARRSGLSGAPASAPKPGESTE